MPLRNQSPAGKYGKVRKVSTSTRVVTSQSLGDALEMLVVLSHLFLCLLSLSLSLVHVLWGLSHGNEGDFKRLQWDVVSIRCVTLLHGRLLA
jgi:hypothetical protein